MTTFASFQQTTTAPATPQAQPGTLSRVGNGIANAGKDAFNTLIGTPATRFGQAIGAGIAPWLGGTSQGADFASKQDATIPALGGINVPAQKAFGQGGAEQIGGQALKSASYLIPGGAAEGVAQQGIVRGAVQGAGIGAVSGGLGGAGNAMSQGQSASNVLNAGVGGAATGALVGGVAGLAGNVWNKVYSGEGAGSYQSNLDAATQAQTQAGQEGLKAGNELTGTFSDIKNDASAQFKQAPLDIMRAKPEAQAIIPTELVGKMNAVKGGAGFELPGKTDISSPQFGGDIKLGDISGGGVAHTPEEMQDLIGKFNDVAFKAKASGELKINQQAASVVRELHDIASKSFGDVTDAQGNSIWDNAYQNYRQVSDLTDKMSGLFNINRTPGEISAPDDMKTMLDKINKYGESTQGRAVLQQAAQQVKAATGYDISDPIGTILKISDSDENFAKALKGGFGHQFVQGLKSPTMLSRRAMYTAGTILGITAVGTAFRKQVGAAISGK